MIYDTKPSNFRPLYSTVSCVLLSNFGSILLLLSRERKNGPSWDVPHASIEPYEQRNDTLRRVVRESLCIDPFADRFNLDPIWEFAGCDDQQMHFSAFVGVIRVPADPLPIKLNSFEFADYRWKSPLQAVSFNLHNDLKGYLERVFDLVPAPPRSICWSPR